MSSYSSTYPSVSPSYQIDFSNGGRIPPNATFSRSDSPIDASKAAASAVHFWSNEKHLSSENLLPYSNNLSSADWTKSRLTVDSVNNTAPDGGTDASLLLETADTGTHTFYDSFNCVSGQNYSFIFYAKPNGRTKLLFRPQATGIIASLVFDLSGSGTVTLSSGSTVSHSITQVGDYYKCQATVTATATGAGYTQVYLDNGSTTSYAGDVTKGVIFWGHQISSTSETVLNETSGQIARSYAPTLKSVATAGAARFEYDPTDGQSEGILIEGQSTNLNTYSKNGTNSSGVYQYSTSYVVATPNAAVAPDGTLSATLLTSTDAGSATVHSSYANLTGIAGSTAHTMSVFAKAAGHDTLVIHAGATYGAFGANIYGTFTLTGSGTAAASGGTATAQIESCGNGWFRCSLTETTASSPTGMRLYYYVDASSTYQGDDYSGLLLWGFQTEAQSAPSSWVDTGNIGYTATRAADSLSVATADIGYTGGPFTVVSETSDGLGSYPKAFALTDGTLSNRVTVHRESASATTSVDWTVASVRDGSLDVFQAIPSSASAGKVALSYSTNDVSFCASGGTVTTDSSAAIPSGLTTIYVGANYAGGQQLNGHVKRIAIFGEALSDQNLISLTS